MELIWRNWWRKFAYKDLLMQNYNIDDKIPENWNCFTILNNNMEFSMSWYKSNYLHLNLLIHFNPACSNSCWKNYSSTKSKFYRVVLLHKIKETLTWVCKSFVIRRYKKEFAWLQIMIDRCITKYWHKLCQNVSVRYILFVQIYHIK